MEQAIKIIPTGVKSLDKVLNGGLPSGSVILLQNEIGSGAHHFLYTSILMLSRLMEENRSKNAGMVLPGRICYISFTRPQDYIVQEVSGIKLASIEDVEKHVEFIDMSERYFKNTIVPGSWLRNDEAADGGKIKGGKGHSGLKQVAKESGGNMDLVREFIRIIDKHASNNMIVIDALTDLFRSFPSSANGWNETIWLMKGIERMAKVRNAMVYVLLPAGIVDGGKQEEVQDCVDTVLEFKWDYVSMPPRKKMYIKKLRGYMPFAEEGHMAAFETKTSAAGGLEVSNIREIVGK